MRWFIYATISCLYIGGLLLIRANQFPLYTDPGAPDRLADEIAAKYQVYASPTAANAASEEWFARLAPLKTLHEKLSDWGSFLISVGVGLFLALSGWCLYHRHAWARSGRCIFIVWALLWLTLIPATFSYYLIRELRFDYPAWADSIAIPIFSESITWLVGLMISSAVLFIMLKNHPLPERIVIHWPESSRERFRFVLLSIWMVSITILALADIPHGELGGPITCPPALVILCAVLAARPNQASNGTDPSTSSG